MYIIYCLDIKIWKWLNFYLQTQNQAFQGLFSSHSATKNSVISWCFLGSQHPSLPGTWTSQMPRVRLGRGDLMFLFDCYITRNIEFRQITVSLKNKSGQHFPSTQAWIQSLIIFLSSSFHSESNCTMIGQFNVPYSTSRPASHGNDLKCFLSSTW